MTNELHFSDNGCAFLEESEGKRSKKYCDTEGNWTIGIGHLIKAGETFPEELTEEQIYDLLKNDVKTAADDVNRMVKVPLTQNQFDALVCLVFNIGGALFYKSSILRLLNEGNYEEAGNRFTLYNKERIDGELVENDGLTARREREQELFFTES